jgi:hypothetical protein
MTTLSIIPGGFSTACEWTIADTLENDVRQARRFFGRIDVNASRICLNFEMPQFV